uniref:Putative secreted protein n=1 Tax=Ixodes ricinus TaxID=34613 RepID=A0A6B0UEQ4_IXORI
MWSRPQGRASRMQCSSTICIFLATPSSCVCSRRILWAMRTGGVQPSVMGGRDATAIRELPDTKCICTAAWSFFRANSPCHITGYLCSRKESPCGGTWVA